MKEQEVTPLLAAAKGGGRLDPTSAKVDEDANPTRRRSVLAAGSQIDGTNSKNSQTQHYFGGKFDPPLLKRNVFTEKKYKFRPSWVMSSIMRSISKIFQAKPNIKAQQIESQYYQDMHNDLPWRCTFGTSPQDGIWLNYTDVPGLVMSITVWLLIGYSCFTVNLLVQTTESISPFVGMVYTTFCTLALASHVKTQFTDPGSIPPSAIPTEQDSRINNSVRICSVCNTYKPPIKTHHCSICNRCISGMDHHCPWMNNCIGAGNLKHFILFLSYVWISSTFALVLFGVNYFFCASDQCAFNGLVIHLVRVMTVLCIGALIFTSNMIVNVVWAVMTGLGTIDRLKLQRDALKSGESSSLSDQDYVGEPIPLTDIFGIGAYWTWIFPMDPNFDDYDRVMRYSSSARLLREKEEREELTLI